MVRSASAIGESYKRVRASGVARASKRVPRMGKAGSSVSVRGLHAHKLIHELCVCPVGGRASRKSLAPVRSDVLLLEAVRDERQRLLDAVCLAVVDDGVAAAAGAGRLIFCQAGIRCTALAAAALQGKGNASVVA